MNTEPGPQIKLILGDDRKSLKVAILNEGVIRSGIELSTVQLDNLMTGLGQLRLHMEPAPRVMEPAPPEIEPGPAMEPWPPVKIRHDSPPQNAPNAEFHFGTDKNSGELVLSLRSPDSDWLSLRLTIRQLERMLGVARKTSKRIG
jgi:hypothetical protein